MGLGLQLGSPFGGGPGCGRKSKFLALALSWLLVVLVHRLVVYVDCCDVASLGVEVVGHGRRIVLV